MLDRPDKRRSASSRLADLGDRLARSFSRVEPDNDWEADGDLVDIQRTESWDPHAPRFPITRQGYECNAVDEYVGDLERELVELERELDQVKARTPSGNEVAAEIQRVGEQTSSILMAAHDQAQETTRTAQAQADRVLADAAAQAITITEEANRKLQQMQADQRALHRERMRLVEDIRGMSAVLQKVAHDAEDRFPEEGEPAGTEPVSIEPAPAEAGTGEQQ